LFDFVDNTNIESISGFQAV